MPTKSLSPVATLFLSLLLATTPPLRAVENWPWYNVDTTYWYPFAPTCTAEAGEIGLQGWLPKPAGAGGRILNDGGVLRYAGNSQPVKLWGFNLGAADVVRSAAEYDQMVPFIAKYGVNLVRFHKILQGYTRLLDGDSFSGLSSGTGSGMDKFDYFVSKLKENGIYANFSTSWEVQIFENDKAGIPYWQEFKDAYGEGNWYDGKKYVNVTPTAYGQDAPTPAYFLPEIANLKINQVKALLNHTNPYTGLKYANDPCVAMVEMLNETNITTLLWDYIMKPQLATFRQQACLQFCDWLRDKYSNDEAQFLATWGYQALHMYDGRLDDTGLTFFNNPRWANNNIAPVSDNLGFGSLDFQAVDDFAIGNPSVLVNGAFTGALTGTANTWVNQNDAGKGWMIVTGSTRWNRDAAKSWAYADDSGYRSMIQVVKNSYALRNSQPLSFAAINDGRDNVLKVFVWGVNGNFKISNANETAPAGNNSTPVVVELLNTSVGGEEYEWTDFLATLPMGGGGYEYLVVKVWTDLVKTTPMYWEARAKDTMQFLYGKQKAFYQNFRNQIEGTGYAGEMIASNWPLGSGVPAYFNLYNEQIDTTANEPNGMIDRHQYMAYGDRSLLRVPGCEVLGDGYSQIIDRPFMFSEWCQSWANPFTIESRAIMAAYGFGLQGWDAATQLPGGDYLANGGSPINGVMQFGNQYFNPATTCMYPFILRQMFRGDVAESPVVARRPVHFASLNSEGKLGFDDYGYSGELIGSDSTSGLRVFESDIIDRRVPAVAKTAVVFTGSYQEGEFFPIEDYIEMSGTVPVFRSATGELRWREGAGISRFDGNFTVNTARTKGFIGFAQGEEFVLGDVKIKPKSPFAAVYVTAKDRNATSIASAGELLVLVLGRQRNTYMEYLADGRVAGATLDFSNLVSGTTASGFTVTGSDGNSFRFDADPGKQLKVYVDGTNNWLGTGGTNQGLTFHRTGDSPFNLSGMTFFNRVAATRTYSVVATFVSGSQATVVVSATANQKKLQTFAWTALQQVRVAPNQADNTLWLDDVTYGMGGTAPVLMENIEAEVTINNHTGTPTVYKLDHDGIRTSSTIPVASGKFTVNTRYQQSPYFIVQYGPSGGNPVVNPEFDSALVGQTSWADSARDKGTGWAVHSGTAGSRWNRVAAADSYASADNAGANAMVQIIPGTGLTGTKTFSFDVANSGANTLKVYAWGVSAECKVNLYDAAVPKSTSYGDLVPAPVELYKDESLGGTTYGWKTVSGTLNLGASGYQYIVIKAYTNGVTSPKTQWLDSVKIE